MQFADEELHDASINANPSGDGSVLDDGGKVMGDAMLEVSLPMTATGAGFSALERRATLLARREPGTRKPVYRFDIHMQGEYETVFFDL